MENSALTVSAATLIQSLRKLPSLNVIPGFLELEKQLVKLGIIEEQAIVEDEMPEGVLDMKKEIGPLIWVGLFTLPDPDTGDDAEMPLAYQGSIGNALTYTTRLENVPSLMTVCKTVEAATGYPWRLVEYRANSEWDTNAFGARGVDAVQ
ncbi:MAG: hypothetical protein MI863_20850 [Desulfobacterales bacterium]|nr:hypothetical protein [Desulfobacterales bacterium]